MTGRLRTAALGCVLACAATAVASAQWLNYKTPGIPRAADGTPKLDAPAPRSLDGHPDLTGVWMHELTPMSELRRLYGSRIDDATRTDIPGMEIGTQHKYVWDILIDFPDRLSPDFGHLDVEMTFEDPKMYTRPFTIRVPHNLLADSDIFEMFPENEKDCAHMQP